jgi:hypothetical protein
MRHKGLLKRRLSDGHGYVKACVNPPIMATASSDLQERE